MLDFILVQPIKKKSNLILFNELKKILRDNPLNDDTQRKIEKLLIDSNMTKMNYNGTEFYEIISKLNNNLKNEFIRADTDLRSLIHNFIERKIWEIYESKGKKLSQKKLSLFYLSVILKDVPVDYIISIMLGKVLMIMNTSLIKDDNKNKFSDLENIVFTDIKSILITEGYNNKAQESIERLVYSYLDKISTNKENFIAFLGGFDSDVFSNNKLKEYIFTQLDEFDVYFHKLKSKVKKKIVELQKKLTKKVRLVNLFKHYNKKL